MLAILNQYSFVIGALIVGGLLAAGLRRWTRGPRLLRIGLLAAYLIGIGLYATANRYPDPQVRSVAEADAILSSGQPTFVMLYSNY